MCRYCARVTSPGVGRQAGARVSLVSAWVKMAAMSWLKVRESKSRCAASLSSRSWRPSEAVLSPWMSSRWPPHTASSVSRVCSQSEVSIISTNERSPGPGGSEPRSPEHSPRPRGGAAAAWPRTCHVGGHLEVIRRSLEGH